jgi:peptidoglycan/xylan/chitin deacetylase (PgdA/CDA1 family)
MKKKSAGKTKLVLGIIFVVLCLILGYSIAMRTMVSNSALKTELSNELQETQTNESVSTAEVQAVETAENSLSSLQQGSDGEEFSEVPESQGENEAEKYPDSSHMTAALRGSEIMLVKQGDPYVEPGAFAVDDRFGIIGDYEVQGADKIDTSTVGDYIIEYTIKSENALAKISRTVRVLSPESFGANCSGVPVMMYHCVYTASEPPAKINSNYILDSKLDKQLAWLKENAYYFPSFAELRAYVDGRISLPAKSIILTFDDADAGFLKYGRALLEKHEIPGTTFIIGAFDAENQIKANPSRYLSYESHSYDMHKGGGNIGLGGIISALSYEEIQADLSRAIELLKSRAAFAYPYGDVTETAVQAIRSLDILCSFTTAFGKVKVGDNPARLSRVRVLGESSLEGFIWSIG